MANEAGSEARSATDVRWPARVGYVLFVVLVAGLLCEAALRIGYREPWYQRLIREQREHGSFSYQTNALGLRDGELPADKPAGVRRVLFLGDSFTFGSGVIDPQAVFPRRIERALNPPPDTLPGVDRIEVFNGGIPGSYPAHWDELLERIIQPYAPDVVVVVFFLRDGTRLSSINHFFGPIRDRIVKRNERSTWYRYSYIYRVVRDALDRRLVARDYTRALRRGYFGSRERTQHWREQQQHLRSIFQRCREHGAAVGMVVFPVLAELDRHPYPFDRIVKLLGRFARQQGVPSFDLMRAFRGHHGPELWVSAYDQHPNAAAHAIAAGALVPFVRRLLQQAETTHARGSESHHP